MAVFIPTYFSPISQYREILKSDEVIFETEDNYQKQGYRNRCYIYGPNGKQLLNIPIKHHKKPCKTKDILIDNSVSWQKQHLKSLETAYKSSPFFEFYIDDLLPIFKKKYTYLLDLNLDCFLLLSEALEISSSVKKTTIYQNYPEKEDFRFLANVKQKTENHFVPYTQVFDDKHGFLPNLSVLDLLFMEGPNTTNLLT